MQSQMEETTQLFNVGDHVKVSGTDQVLKIIDCKSVMPHVYIESVKAIHYKCEWTHPNKEVLSAWYPASRLEAAKLKKR